MKNPIKKIKFHIIKSIKSTIRALDKHLYNYFKKKIQRPDDPRGALSKFEIRSRVDFGIRLSIILVVISTISLIIYLFV